MGWPTHARGVRERKRLHARKIIQEKATGVKLGLILGHDGAILGHLGEYLGDLGAIFAGLGGY